MKEESKYNTVVREFSSISEFCSFIKNTPTNKEFSGKELHSKTGDASFTGTKSYEEAEHLLEYGWPDGSKKIESKLKAIKEQQVNNEVKRMGLDLVGFQACVPAYLQGLPNNMFNKHPKVQKQKVVTITKDVSYPGMVSKENIMESSLMALALVKKVEASGVRVNLNIILGTSNHGHREIAKIRIKSAGERLNISKTAFPLAHTSMLRRMLFKYIEVTPTITPGFYPNYGAPVQPEDLKKRCEGEYFIPKFLTQDKVDHDNALAQFLVKK